MSTAAVLAAMESTMSETDLLELSGPAWRLAVRVLGSREFAEDVVQQAMLIAVGRLRKGAPPEDLRTWFLRVVGNVARKHLRGEARRQRREAAVVRATLPEAPPEADAELVAELGRAVEALDEKYRVPVALCCEEGLTHREAAAVLEMPERTVSKYVQVGLEELRGSLSRAGYAAAPAAVMAGLAHTAPAVPAALSATLSKLVAGQMAVKGTGAAAATSAAMKGGIIVKIGLGVAAVGLAAGATFYVVGGHTGEPAKSAAATQILGGAPADAPAAGKRKFATPFWSPDAQWEMDPNWSIGMPGFLDGPVREGMWRRGPGAFKDLLVNMPDGYPYAVWGYDSVNDRYHVTCGGTRGYLDGPFSRVRWGGVNYSNRAPLKTSPDRRFFVVGDVSVGGPLRIGDLKDQMVRTILPPGSKINALCFNAKGQILAFQGQKYTLLDPVTGKVVEEKALKGGKTMDFGASVTLDEKHERLYCAGSGVTSTERPGMACFVWYLDLKDGSFHEVLSGKATGPCAGYAGPFDDYKGYAEATVVFGPEDPDFRILYMKATDTIAFMRLDLERRVVAMFSAPPAGKNSPCMWVEKTSDFRGFPSVEGAQAWLDDGSGDFIMGSGGGTGQFAMFRRIK